MAKSIKSRFDAYRVDLKDVFDRFKSEELDWKPAIREAWTVTRKAVYRISKGETSHGRKQAIELVKRGMKAYNAKNYTDAEELFRRATGKDCGYGRAYAYLGNTLYKQKRITDAVSAWNKAIEVEPNSDAADVAKEKLMSMGKGREGFLEVATDLVRTRG